jgi:hypothetical protein
VFSISADKYRIALKIPFSFPIWIKVQKQVSFREDIVSLFFVEIIKSQ